MSDFVYILILSFLPIVYKLSFWLYAIQLKEYRIDRFFEYLTTKQGKKALFNILFFLEFIVLILSILYFNGIIQEKVIYYSLVFLLQFESLFVFYKIFSLKFIVPKRTWRILILWAVIILHILSLIYFFYYNQILIYLFLPLLLAFFSFYVLFWNFITSFIFDYIKDKKFKQAFKKLEKFKKLKKIWITGSFGKSSMKEYLSHLLEKQFYVIKTPKNINTELWISNFIFKTDFSKYDYFIAEMWAYRKWEIKTLWNIVNQKDAFVTWIWNQHIWLFKWQQNIIDWKFEIWEKVLKNKWKLFVNIDSFKEINKDKIILEDRLWFTNFEWKTPQILKNLLENNQVVFYGLKWWKYKWEILNINENGTEFKLNDKIYKTNLIWEGQIINLIWAMSYLLENNIEIEEKLLKNMQQPEHTMIVSKDEKNNIIKIDDTYNLSVNSLLNAIDILKYFDGEKIIILDDILELWKDAKKIHEKIWEYLSDKIDAIYFVWVNYKEDIIKWLEKWWFKWKILEKIPFFTQNQVFLYEWKKSGKFIK